MTTEQIQELYRIMDITWGDGEDHVDSMIEFIGDYDLIIKIMKKDLTFNRYCDIYNWTELANLIICDELLWEEGIDETYIYLANVERTEAEIKKLLVSQNWAIDTTTGVAIGFDDNVNVLNHEINKK